MSALATCPILDTMDDKNTSPEYAAWLERKVQASLNGLRDGSNRTFSATEWDAIRATRLAMRNGS